ncbi:MAG: hypothetical protein WB508_10675 [Aeromicrobium sp.]|uniref:hypothetical protein n=1 Tax=Aeromicrobium sp. TaxID=1871063 RepID=UPI003C4C22FF
MKRLTALGLLLSLVGLTGCSSSDEAAVVALPIEYPAGKDLPDLGKAPGPLAAIWWTSPAGDEAVEAVGLVAETGKFGTLPIDVVRGWDGDGPGFVLSPDGRMIAYSSPDKVVIHDLASGRKEFPTIKTSDALVPYGWIDGNHLYGIASLPNPSGNPDEGGWWDSYGWAWEPGEGAKLVNLGEFPGHPHLGYGRPYAGTGLTIAGSGDGSCADALVLREVSTDGPDGEPFLVPVLCDVLGVVGSEILLGHWNSEQSAGESSDPRYADGTLVALDLRGADLPFVDPALRGPDADQAFNDPALRRVVVTAGAPHLVSFATDLIGEALEADRGAS